MAKEKIPLIMRLVGHLHYYHKFVIISVLFGVSIFLSLFFMISSQSEVINRTYLEIEGNRYEQKIVRVLGDIIKHQELTAEYLGGNQTLRSELISTESQINNDFRALVTQDADKGYLFNTSASDFQRRDLPNLKPTEIERNWQALARQIFEMTPMQSAEQHLELISSLKQLIGYIGENAGLQLDPEQESYYLVVSLLNLLPEAQELIPELNARVVGADDSTAQNNTIQLATMLRTNIEQTRNAIQKSYLLNEKGSEEEVENIIREPLRQYLSVANDYLNVLFGSVLSGKEFSTREFTSLGYKTLGDNLSLWLIASDQLELLLTERISSIRLQQWWRIGLVLLFSITAFLFGMHVLKEAMSPIYKLMDVTKQLAEGNLSARAPVVYDDTIGSLSRSINTVAESFQELIGQLQWTGIQLTTSTTQIAAAAKQQEATVVQQEATTKEIAVTAREISATAKDFAKTMSEVSVSAEETSQLATLGKSAIDQMQSIIHLLVEASSNISGKLNVLNEKAGTITGVVTTISKVADQTNLLSLNAAIEAEKAGEHGRSFAVIAREIRHLADQTASATTDIENMVNEMVSAVSAGVMGVDKFSAEIQNAVSQVSAVSEHLTKIIEQVQNQTSSFESVNQGMQAQSLGAEQINESIIQLSEVAQQTADSIRQFHRAVEQLNNAAQEMQNSVVKLKN